MDAQTTANTAHPSTFFLLNMKRRPMIIEIRKKSEIAESNKNKLQYFLPKGPKSEFMYT